MKASRNRGQPCRVSHNTRDERSPSSANADGPIVEAAAEHLLVFMERHNARRMMSNT